MPFSRKQLDWIRNQFGKLWHSGRRQWTEWRETIAGFRPSKIPTPPFLEAFKPRRQIQKRRTPSWAKRISFFRSGQLSSSGSNYSFLMSSPAFNSVTTSLGSPFSHFSAQRLNDYGEMHDGMGFSPGKTSRFPFNRKASTTPAGKRLIQPQNYKCDDALEKAYFHSEDAGDSSKNFLLDLNPEEKGRESNTLSPNRLSLSPAQKELEEDPEFNEWQFWRVPSEFCLPDHVLKELKKGTRDKENLVHETKADTPTRPTNPESESFITYILSPCSECDLQSQPNKSLLPPLTFWASGLNFCGHPRRFFLNMGNQAGKEPSKDKESKKGKGFGRLRRGDTKGSLAPAEGTAHPSKQPATQSTKNRAPPPPPPTIGRVLSNEGKSGDLPGGKLVRNEDMGQDEEPSLSLSRRGSSFSNNLDLTGSQAELLSLEDYSLSENSSCTFGEEYKTAVTGQSITGSYYSAIANISPLDDDGDDDTLRNQSDQLSIDSIELIMPIAETNGNLSFDEDNAVFSSELTMSSTDLNYNGSQRPLTTSFTLTRKRKVELSSVSSPVEESPTSGFIGAKKEGGSEQCLAGGYGEEFATGSNGGPPLARRYNSVTDVPTPDSNVLRKVASLTLAEQQTQQAQARALTKPKFVPEKLDFRLYEKFEGRMLIHWFVSCFEEGNYIKDTLSVQDLKYIANQFCTLLLSAGVLKQIEEIEGQADKIFRPDSIYYWSHLESPAVSCQIPGKLPPVSWPPTQDGAIPMRNGAKYTEAGEGLEGGVRTLSPEHLPQPGTVPKTVSQFESECDLSRIETSENSAPEFQQMVMGLKRTHKEILQKKIEAHEVEVFSVRGETQEATEKKYAARIAELETECEKLRTMMNTQNSTSKVGDDASCSVEGVPLPASGPPPPPPPPMPPGAGSSFVAPPPPPPPPMPPGSGVPSVPPPPPPPPMMPGTFAPPPPPPPPMGGPVPPPPPPPMGGPVPPPPPPGMLGQVGPSAPSPPTAPSLPAPPPGGWQMRFEARKKPISPKMPMKPLYWTRIQIKEPVAPGSTNNEKDGETKLWEKLEEVSVGSWDDFTKLFSRQVIERKELKAKKEDKVPTVKAVSILDPKKAQNVGIFIRSNKLEDDKRNPDISKIRDAVFELDLSEVKLETLEKILDIKPTEEEYALMKDHLQSNPDLPLEKADRFLYDLNSIPKFSERIMCFTFQFSFAESFTSIETKLSNFRLVCEQLMSSKDLKNVLALILTYGNYMNGGNMQRGQADGFTLDILPKLRDVKSKDNAYTFLHFIVSTYIKNYDEFRGTTESKLPTPEPSDIEAAASLNFEDAETDIHKLKEKLKHCEKQAEGVISSSSEDTAEPFKSKMLSFLDQARVKVQDVEENLIEGKKTFVRTMKFFDFTPKPKKRGELPLPSDFFLPWNVFCHDFKEIWKNEQRRIFNERRRHEDEVTKQFLQSKRLGISKLPKQPKKAGGLKDRLMNRLNKQREGN